MDCSKCEYIYIFFFHLSRNAACLGGKIITSLVYHDFDNMVERMKGKQQDAFERGDVRSNSPIFEALGDARYIGKFDEQSL